MTPDRFDAMVKKIEFTDFDGLQAVLSTDVVKLLRREHAAVRRMVKKLRKEENTAWVRSSGYNEACRDILAALDARKKGVR